MASYTFSAYSDSIFAVTSLTVETKQYNELSDLAIKKYKLGEISGWKLEGLNIGYNLVIEPKVGPVVKIGNNTYSPYIVKTIEAKNRQKAIELFGSLDKRGLWRWNGVQLPDTDFNVKNYWVIDNNKKLPLISVTPTEVTHGEVTVLNINVSYSIDSLTVPAIGEVTVDDGPYISLSSGATTCTVVYQYPGTRLLSVKFKGSNNDPYILEDSTLEAIIKVI